jgi:hypothetical protein
VGTQPVIRAAMRAYWGAVTAVLGPVG